MDRIVYQNSGKRVNGDYILYWMQQSQRGECNPALEKGIAEANRRHLPLIVLFVLFQVDAGAYGGAGRRHYHFMLQGLEETRRRLADRGIGFILLPRESAQESAQESARRGSDRGSDPRSARGTAGVVDSVLTKGTAGGLVGDPTEGVLAYSSRAAALVLDSGYTRVQRLWRRRIIEEVDCPVFALEGDLVVPPLIVSAKEEYAAATIRKKIHRQLPFFLLKPEEQEVKIPSLSLAAELGGAELGGSELAGGEDSAGGWIEAIEGSLSFPGPEIPPVSWITGGRREARLRFDRFISDGKLERFHEERNDPSKEGLSNMSPYLHYGQISALELALEASTYPGPGSEAFLEELVIRRELAFNFVIFNPVYDQFDCLPDWARNDLEAHGADPRDYIYSEEELLSGETHDPYWNGAQKELVHLGKIHGYMRMYWGKKILEWTPNPREGYRIALAFNDRYSLDGRDPNGYAGVAWCFGKHDRPWASRKVFGKVRYMNDRGLERKFAIKEYVTRVDRAVKQELRSGDGEVGRDGK